MGFDARESLANAQTEYPPFPVTGLDGEVHEMPHINMLTPEAKADVVEAFAALSKSEDERDVGDVYDVMRPMASGAVAAVEGLPDIVQAEFFKAWAVHMGFELEDEDEGADAEPVDGDPPKPSATASATPKAAKQSKRTSPSKASSGTRSGRTKPKARSAA